MCQKLHYCARKIDPCLTARVKEINDDPNLRTLSCCCGHGKYDPTIVVLHKACRIAYEYFTGTYLGPHPRPMNRYYKKDGKKKSDHYYLPELQAELPIIIMPTNNPLELRHPKRIKLDTAEAMQSAMQQQTYRL